jgi:WD40 repeat protein/predicted Ser/Thr protein kinase
MGEVWRAFDLKLRVDVALKALRQDLFKSEGRLESLRQEVRAAREVVSPNVCRVFDLIELEGRELVSMEYIDGRTLLEVLKERGPLDLKEAQEIASQFLAGLEAIHRAGLIHRDIKPENIMLTRAGRVVVMDFGIARQQAEGSGTVSGTPAYMAPEQARGEVEDARADVYAAGVVLAEMVCPGGIKDLDSRKSLWDGVLSEPPKLPDSLWAPVLRHAVAKDREARYRSAHTLTRALEEITLRVEGAEDLHPYPGLMSFTESDAEYFFGREAEVEEMWRKLEGAPRLLALVGPSGAGKTSFVRAGLIPKAGSGWRCVICTPGSNPELALSRALSPELDGNAGTGDRLLRFDDPEVGAEVVSAWRRRSDHALLVIDQFEELFTQNGSEEQARFARTLGALALEADVHVLLSMRDDFLLRCHDHETLKPLFMELTPLATPVGANLRRALTQPALQCGYRFEDDALVAEMLGEVEGERGALPLLAFAAARLWEKRDRKTGLLTRSAFQDIGGVGGALARHAEATMDRIGPERIGIVREIFRNLVTAEGTRAVREWDELLSVFADSRRESASDVLRELVDARLLTSYEVREADGAPTRRVEIIHESLLAAWPRLVRWQAQDTEGALLRDQLRQAARTWAEHDRSDDLLWTGSAFREYAVWRERYPGGLTEIEEAFGEAMTSLAGRRRRRRRVAVSSAMVVLLVVAAALSLLWRRSVEHTRRAEAAKLLALAQARIGDDPTEALALTTASLEVADTREAREFVVRALWTAPPALELAVIEGAQLGFLSFSPDGGHVAVAGFAPVVKVWSNDGGGPVQLPRHSLAVDAPSAEIFVAGTLVVAPKARFSVENEMLAFGDRVRVWSIPDGKLLREIDFALPAYWQPGVGQLLARSELGEGAERRIELRSWMLPEGEEELLGVLGAPELDGISDLVAAPDGSGWVAARGREVSFRPLERGGRERLLEAMEAEASLTPFGEASILARDKVGNARLWSFGGGEPGRVWAIRCPAGATGALPDRDGRRVANLGPRGQFLQLWEVAGLPGAGPLELRRSGWWYDPDFAFHPTGGWCVASTHAQKRLTFWPVARPQPSVVEAYEFPRYRKPIAFTPDSQWLATGWGEEAVRLLPVRGGDPHQVRELRLPGAPQCSDLRFDAAGRNLLLVSMGDAWIVPLDGGPPRQVAPEVAGRQIESGAISPSGARIASAVLGGEGAMELFVFDLSAGGLQRLALPRPETSTGIPEGVTNLEFLDEQTLITAGWGGIRRWDLAAGTQELVVAADGHLQMRASRTAGIAVHWNWAADLSPGLERIELVELASGRTRTLEGFGDDVESADIDPSGTVLATGHRDGTVRVGRVDGGEAHLLPGHKVQVSRVAVSHDLRWVASSDEDNSLRLWPMPDLSKPPLHTLPHGELIAKLKTLTNLRAVRDPNSSTGWTIELGPFPGWKHVPTW